MYTHPCVLAAATRIRDLAHAVGRSSFQYTRLASQSSRLRTARRSEPFLHTTRSTDTDPVAGLQIRDNLDVHIIAEAGLPPARNWLPLLEDPDRLATDRG